MQLVRHGFFQTLMWFFTLILLFWARELFLGYSSLQGDYHVGMMPLAKMIGDYVSGVNRLDMALTILLVFVNSFFITRIIIRHVIFISRSYSMALVFLALCSALPSSSIRYLSYIYVYLLLLSLDYLMTIFRRKEVAYRLFASGALLSLASLFYAPILLLSLVSIFGMILYEHSSFREYLSFIIGLIAPIFAYGYISWLIGGDFLYIYDQYLVAFGEVYNAPSPSIASFSVINIVYCVMLLVMVVYSVVFYLGRINQERAKSVRTYSIFIFMLIVLLVMIALKLAILPALMALISIPVSVIIVTMLTKNSASMVVNIVYLLLILGALVVSFKGFFID